jgi:membrane-bound lytic murein transglycosylase D
MNRLVPFHVLVGFFVLFAPALAHSQPRSVILAAASPRLDGKSGNAIPGEEDLPSRLSDIIQTSRARYLEGSNLIQSGESAKARIAFDQAVDMILQSDYNLSATPELNTFFLELIRNIQRDESRYLLSDEGAEEKPEGAVVDELAKVDLIPIAIDPALKDVVEADILNTKYGIPVVVNESVLKSMNYWSTRGRKYFIDGLSRSGRYQEMIERIFREESLPLDLMYLAQVESLFKTNALSRAQAKGIWQFVTGTAIRYGLKVNRYIDERSDPEKSTRAGISTTCTPCSTTGTWCSRHITGVKVRFSGWWRQAGRPTSGNWPRSGERCRSKPKTTSL